MTRKFLVISLFLLMFGGFVLEPRIGSANRFSSRQPAITSEFVLVEQRQNLNRCDRIPNLPATACLSGQACCRTVVTANAPGGYVCCNRGQTCDFNKGCYSTRLTCKECRRKEKACQEQCDTKYAGDHRAIDRCDDACGPCTFFADCDPP